MKCWSRTQLEGKGGIMTLDTWRRHKRVQVPQMGRMDADDDSWGFLLASEWRTGSWKMVGTHSLGYALEHVEINHDHEWLSTHEN